MVSCNDGSGTKSDLERWGSLFSNIVFCSFSLPPSSVFVGHCCCPRSCVPPLSEIAAHVHVAGIVINQNLLGRGRGNRNWDLGFFFFFGNNQEVGRGVDKEVGGLAHGGEDLMGRGRGRGYFKGKTNVAPITFAADLRNKNELHCID